MDQKFKQLISLFGEHRVKLNEPLKSYIVSNVEAEAEAFFIATNQKELIDIIKAAINLQIPYQILGAGTKFLLTNTLISGLVVKNRTSNIKISGVKGKVGVNGIGVEEAMVEVDSGVSLGRINQFLESQKLPLINFTSSKDATLGGSLLIESPIYQQIQAVRILQKDQIEEIEINDLTKSHIILSVVFKIKA